MDGGGGGGGGGGGAPLAVCGDVWTSALTRPSDSASMSVLPSPMYQASMPLGFDGLHVCMPTAHAAGVRDVGGMVTQPAVARRLRASSAQPRSAHWCNASSRARDAPRSTAPARSSAKSRPPSAITVAFEHRERPRTAPNAASDLVVATVKPRAGSALGQAARQRGAARAANALWTLPAMPTFQLATDYMQDSTEIPFGAPPRRQMEARQTHLYLRDLGRTNGPKSSSISYEAIVARHASRLPGGSIPYAPYSRKGAGPDRDGRRP